VIARVLPIEKRLFALGERHLDAANADIRNQLQELNVLTYLTAAITAHRRRQVAASLLRRVHTT
jgi:hypothetical protein